MTGPYAGAAPVPGVYAGTAPVAAIYAGDQLIWPTTPQHTIYDDFERSTLGAAWSTYGNAPVIVSGAMHASTTTATATGKAYYTTQLPGDDATVGVTIGAILDSVQKTTIRLGTDPTINAADYLSYVCVNVNASSWEIVSRDPAYTTRGSGSWTLSAGDTIELARSGSTVTLARNGALVRSASFPQPPTGPGTRYVSVDMNTYYSGGIFGQNYYSPTLGELWAD